MYRVLALLLALAATSVPFAQAQVGVPGLPAVPVPLPNVGVDVGRTVDGVGRAAGGALAEVRRLRIESLLRTERRAVEADPRGAPVLRGEVVASDADPAVLAQARGAGFVTLRETEHVELGLRVVVMRAPQGWSARRALRWFTERDARGTYEFNHLYFESGATPAGSAAAAAAGVSAAGVSAAAPSNARIAGEGGAAAAGASLDPSRVGLVDGGVDAAHPALRGTRVEHHGCEGRVVPSAHGTAVASLLVGQADAFRGANPGAHLHAADVYCGAKVGGAADAIVAAFGWLARERVAVINVSLVGPPNRLLGAAIARLQARGHLVVAAVGNDGPGAPPLYPAAYPGVVAVSAVDARDRALPEACRGAHVAFAAPGADLAAADARGGFVAVRGTSFATPLVAGLLAAELAAGSAPASAVEALAARAEDLGAKGRDRIYGFGLVAAHLRNDPKAFGATTAASR